ncbi:MAG: SulP family inorganic anion transporter [Ignavibacteria bacterium]|nr:SulP family inorganic anion transporter [Ignavibacteria bacterium]
MKSISELIPGIQIFTKYKGEWLGKDLIAGLSVAAIALPVGIAYAGLAGLPPETGLYSSILPVVAYALFGTSRQLIIGPDSATCMLVSSALLSVAVAGSSEYRAFSTLLAVVVGLLCIAGGIFKLGFLANFLSKPILNGYLNGLAISIIAGQLGKFMGFKIETSGFFRMIFEFISKIGQTHFYTILIGAITFIFLRFFKKYFKSLPAPLVAVAGGIVVAWMFGLDQKGVTVVGHVPAGFPPFVFPDLISGDTPKIFMESIGIVLITFCSMMLTSKSFASKNGYTVNANKDFVALGISNVLSGFTSGFVVSGADSRTAVNDSAGGKTQLVSIVAAITMSLIAILFTQSLSYLPIATLSAIIISASIGLFNFDYLKRLYKVSPPEFRLAVFTSLSVITIGVIPAVVVAIGLSLLKLIARTSAPTDAILGKVVDTGVYHNVELFREAKTFEGLLIYRFDAPILFFNSDHFTRRARQITSEQEDNVRYLLIDAGSIINMDITAADTLISLVEELRSRGIGFGIAEIKGNLRRMFTDSGLEETIGSQNIFETVEVGVQHFLKSKQ